MVIKKKVSKDRTVRDKLKQKIGSEMTSAIENLSDVEVFDLNAIINKPHIKVRINKRSAKRGISVELPYGNINIDSSLKNIEDVYVNDVKYGVIESDNHFEILNELVNGDPREVLVGKKIGTNSVSRPALSRPSRRLGAPTPPAPPTPPRKPGEPDPTRIISAGKVENTQDMDFQFYQQQALLELRAAKINYKNFFVEMSGIIKGKNYDRETIRQELASNEVPEEEIPEFLVYGSEFNREIVGNIFGKEFGTNKRRYEFKDVKKDNETFLGKLMTRLDIDEAKYDERYGTLKVGDRLITNLPNVDKNGVFHGPNNTTYIPYHIGYFAEGAGSRIDRLRVIDPVEKHLDALALQYELTRGDVKFKTILDVSRNLPDFENHELGEALLEAYKNKVVLEKDLLKTNSLANAFRGYADDLGAVNTMMLDEEAKGLIDPYGTSNGANLGGIFYLTSGSTFNPDGTLTASGNKHTQLGDIMNEFNVATDNFNRNQMSFNALLTSVGIAKVNVAYAEAGMFNAEDAVVLMDSGAKKLASEHTEEYKEIETFERNGETHEREVIKKREVIKDMQTGDKVIDMHGDKSVSSIVIDRNMSDEEAQKERLAPLVKLAKNNPDLDMIVSPVSLNSRLNLGIAKEALMGNKKDLVLNDGSVVKDGIVEMHYIILPQTAEHKAKDYTKDSGSRNFSTLYRNALASKVGVELYEKALLGKDVIESNKERVVLHSERLGISFKDDDKLFEKGNVQPFVSADKSIDMSEFKFKTPVYIRKRLANELTDGSVNILTGDIEITSAITGKPIVDEEGRNVLPIRIANEKLSAHGKSLAVNKEGTVQPFRYNEMYDQLSKGNPNELNKAYQRACNEDYAALTAKENVIKNIKSIAIKNGAKTEMIIPDPRIGIDEIRTSKASDRVLAHRDPALHSGNVISFKNVGGASENLTSVNPIMINQVDGDFDSDTMGILDYKVLGFSSKEEADEFFNRSSVTEQLNLYGKVFLAVGSSHFKAGALVNNIDLSPITFKDGKSNEELKKVVEDIQAQIVDSDKSYGAYAVSFEDEKTVIESLGKLADDGIKGNRKDIEHYFYNGYTEEENKDVMEALIAKSEWTGMGGTITNNFLAAIGDTEFDPKLVRPGMFVTYGATQSVLQLKKNADKLPMVDKNINDMKKIFGGEYDKDIAREVLKECVRPFVDAPIVDEFCDRVEEKQPETAYKFGEGVINNLEMGNTQLGFKNEVEFIETVREMIDPEQEMELDRKGKDFDKIREELKAQEWYLNLNRDSEIDLDEGMVR